MKRRIYTVVLIVSIIIGFYVYGFNPGHYSSTFLLVFTFVPFLLFSIGAFGLIAHLTKPNVKGGLIIYPLVLSLVYIIFLWIHIFVILPRICPDFTPFLNS